MIFSFEACMTPEGHFNKFKTTKSDINLQFDWHFCFINYSMHKVLIHSRFYKKYKFNDLFADFTNVKSDKTRTSLKLFSFKNYLLGNLSASTCTVSKLILTKKKQLSLVFTNELLHQTGMIHAGIRLKWQYLKIRI